MSSYAMDESFTYESDKTAVYYENSNFSNMPLFTEQELYCFLPVQQSIYQNTNTARLAQEESKGYWSQDYTCSKPSMGVYPQFSEMEGYYSQSMDNTIVPVQDCFSMGIQDGYLGGAEEGAYSCQASPFLGQQYPRPAFTNHTQSPITPSGSPMSETTNNFYPNSAPSFMLVPTIIGYESNAQGQECAYSYQSPISSADLDAMTSLPLQILPPVADSPCMSSPALGSPGSDDDDDEEYENDLSLLPQQGNKELRGMGLYDDVPDLLYTNCSTPSGCSPVTPHNTLGKGLVLERSFGLPEEMMMKDDSSGTIVKGKFETEDDDEEPMLYEEEDSVEWDDTYQVTYQPQFDQMAFYGTQINRQW